MVVGMGEEERKERRHRSSLPASGRWGLEEEMGGEGGDDGQGQGLGLLVSLSPFLSLPLSLSLFNSDKELEPSMYINHISGIFGDPQPTLIIDGNKLPSMLDV